MEWLNRMMDALDLMERHMDRPLPVEEIAKAAYSSPFHFQRMFYMVTGMTVAEYMRKRRLTLAAQELSMSSAKVVDVALKYGYDSPESFAKAFRKLHGVSPSEARDKSVPLKAYPRISFHLSLRGDKEMDYRIVEKEAFRVVGMTVVVETQEGEHNKRIPELWRQCNSDGTSAKLGSLSRDGNVLGICLDMKQDRFTYMIGAEPRPDADAGEFAEREIPAATWAVFTSVGPMPGAIQEVWRRIFQEWFPSTGYEHSGKPDLEVYPEGDVGSDDYRCEVWVPVVKK
ncbi:AraC family transcriptional regulator [Paenibacillus flagellatus]|nr:AraC family transcriptional regulator [Paenibacillus flagellatus]